MKLLAHRPGVVTSQMKAFRDIGPTEGELREQFPDWAKKQFAVKFRDNMITGFGLPFESIMELMTEGDRELLLMTNPLLRIPIEKFIINKDLFSGRPLEKINSAKEFKFIVEMTENENVPDFVRESFQKVRNYLKLERDLLLFL